VAIFVEACSEAAAFAKAIHIILELGHDGAQRGDLGGQRAVNDRGQSRDDSGECNQHGQNPFGGDGHRLGYGDPAGAGGLNFD